MTNGILHWGHRSHTDTTPADRDHGLIVPVTLRGEVTPDVIGRIKAAIAAKSTATHHYALTDLADRRGRYTSGPPSSGYVAHVHAILK
jgi:hypothetical protein